MDGWIGEGGFPRWALHQPRNFSRVAEAGKPETTADGILVALGQVEHSGCQLRQWSSWSMVPVANVQARGVGLLVDTRVSGQGFQAYLREPECPTRLWRPGWTQPKRPLKKKHGDGDDGDGDDDDHGWHGNGDDGDDDCDDGDGDDDDDDDD